MGAIKAIGVLALAAVATATSAQDRSAELTGNPGQFFGTDNYPPEALRNGEQGRVIAKLQIGADGKVEACNVDVSSGSVSLDKATCDIALARATFTPARDQRGRAVASTYTLPVRWLLPSGADDVNRFMPIEPLGAVIKQTVAADGTQQACEVTINGQVQNDTRTCEAARQSLPAIAAALPPSLKGQAFVVFNESLQQYSGRPEPRVLDKAGLVALRSRVTSFTITTSGHVDNCQVDGRAATEAELRRPPCADDVPFRQMTGPIEHAVDGTWTESYWVRSANE